MPTYEYRCPKCKKKSEIFHKISEDNSYPCDKCGHLFLKKVPHAGMGAHFKGSGFYETDYKGK